MLRSSRTTFSTRLTARLPPFPKLELRPHQKSRQARRSAKARRPRRDPLVIFRENVFQRGNLWLVSRHILPKSLQVFRGPTVMMITYRPNAWRSRPELKQLLGNPDHPAGTNEWPAKVTVANNANTKLRQQGNRHVIK